MTIATIERAPTAVAAGLARGRGGGGPAPKRVVVAYGFWIFILSDMIMLRRLLCWSLFWHALDIVWVGVFTLVYLM